MVRLVIASLVGLTVIGPAEAAVTVLDPAQVAHLRIGTPHYGYSAFPVAAAPDVNGDGIGDVLVGGPAMGSGCRYPGCDRRWNGTVYVAFGSSQPRDVGIRTEGPDHWRIRRSGGDRSYGATVDAIGNSLAGVGDVNGDGFGDVALGSGRVAWVVFGSASNARVDLATLGARGVALDLPLPDGESAAVRDKALLEVAPVGDMNGDGLADILVTTGAQLESGAPSAWVVFGSDRTGTLNLGDLGGQGIAIHFPESEHPGRGAAVGDLNRDGIVDVAIGVPDAGHRGREKAGATYVVFGRRTPGDLDLASPPAQVFVVDGAAPGDKAALPAPAGDVNGDGFLDLVVGAPLTNYRGRLDSGSAFVFFGPFSPGAADMAVPAEIDVLIEGATGAVFGNRGDMAGSAVTGVGDVDSDGFGELAVLAPGFDGVPGRDTGSVFVIGGRKERAYVDLARAAVRLRLDGASGMAFGGNLAGSPSRHLLVSNPSGEYGLDLSAAAGTGVSIPPTMSISRRSSGAEIALECPAARLAGCVGELVLRRAGREIGRDAFSQQPRTQDAVRVGLPAALIRRVRTGRALWVHAVATTDDGVVSARRVRLGRRR